MSTETRNGIYTGATDKISGAARPGLGETLGRRPRFGSYPPALGETAGHQAGITRVVVCVPRRLVSRDPGAPQAKIAALSGPRVAIHHGLHRLLPGPPFQR
jgi:hypothetical protein